ncbi:hydroxysqualene dehydroxylase HpnE [Desertimonas flava]|jgi:squalene-associated FAD-dependent desaturase|uniref:hydroxysqualene dehydroxylase HpnE n=1 Tax=Desertimonas flava TaxID=2064846 RepID=UPI000E352D69|nr:hydroxysqualene dehydroxylase HpnE [Desertimonas flava]
MRVVVVGGGLAGLSAAVALSDAGVHVTLLEKAPRLGGATWSFRRDGRSYDNGQHVFMRCCTEYLAFLDRIGSSQHVTLQERMTVPVHRPGGPNATLRRVGLPSPLHLAPSLSTYRHLSLTERLGAVRASLALKRLDLDDPSLDEQAFGDWLATHGVAASALPALWDIVIRATINLPSSEASLLLATKVFKTGLLDRNDGADIGWSNVPLQQLHGDAARRVLEDAGAEVRVSAKVAAIESGPDGPVVVLDDGTIAADAVVVAVPHDAVAGLLPSGSFPGQDDVATLGRSPIVNVHLHYDRKVIDQPFLAGVDSPVQFVFDRTDSTFAGDAPAGHQAVAISLSSAEEYLPLSRDQLVERFTAEMARLVPAARSATVVSSMVTREVAATFRGTPGSAHLRPGPTTSIPGVALAGAWTDTGWPATMEGAVRSGNVAARDVLRQIATTESRSGAAA